MSRARENPPGLSCRAWLASLVALFCLSPAIARADPPSNAPSGDPASAARVPRHPGTPLYWDPAFDRMDAPEMVVTGVAAGIALATNVVHPLNTGWSGGILIDNQVRSLRLPTYDYQLEARTVSDLGLALMTTSPFVFDSIIVAYWYRGSEDVALQMGLIDAEALTITAAIEGTSNFLAGRARPYSTECGSGVPSNTTDCETDTRYRSFFSGHTAISFTSAALICAHHEALHLFEGPADHLVCAGGIVAAAGIGFLRIVGDAHYFSDVVVGAVVGSAVGLGVPLLHHYKRSAPGSDPSGLSLSFVPGPTGATIMGTF